MSAADRLGSVTDDPDSGRPSPIDFWRAAIESAAAVLPPKRRAIIGAVVGIGLVVILVWLRAAGADRSILLAWTWLACVIAVASPVTGLVILAGTLPFSEWLVFESVIGAKAIVVPFVVVGVLLRPGGGTGAAPRALRLGLALTAVTGAGLLLTASRFDPPVVERALSGWVAGIGGGLLLFAVAWWAARRGSRFPAAVALVAITVGAALSLGELISPGIIREGLLGVLLRQAPDDLPRVTGIIPAPNAVATLFAAAVAVTVPLAGRLKNGTRPVAWLAVIVLVAAIVFTYSRSGLISLFVVVVLVVAERHPRRALVLGAVGALAGAIALPFFLMLRAEALGVAVSFDLGTVISGDTKRFEGWAASLAMWGASPLVGHGFASFRELAFDYGSHYVTAPHNEILRLFAEGGILAGGTALAFFIVLGRSLWRRGDAWGRAGLGALLALLIGGMFNNPFLYIQVVGPVFILIGAALGTSDEASSPGPA